jgi:hypothetical protein
MRIVLTLLCLAVTTNAQFLLREPTAIRNKPGVGVRDENVLLSYAPKSGGANDYSSFAQHATFTNGCTAVTAYYAFNGANYAVGPTASAAMSSGTSNMTLAIWFKRAGTNQRAVIGVSTVSDGAKGHCLLDAYTDGRVYCQIFNGGVAYGSFLLGESAWHQVAVVIDGTKSGNSSRSVAYLDGVQTNMAYFGTVAAVMPALEDGTRFDIGHTQSGNTFSANGTQIGEVIVWNASLTAEEVKQVYENTRHRY